MPTLKEIRYYEGMTRALCILCSWLYHERNTRQLLVQILIKNGAKIDMPPLDSNPQVGLLSSSAALTLLPGFLECDVAINFEYESTPIEFASPNRHCIRTRSRLELPSKNVHHKPTSATSRISAKNSRNFDVEFLNFRRRISEYENLRCRLRGRKE